MGKNRHTGRLSSGQTAAPPSQGGVNIQPVNITRPPKYILTIGFETNYPNAFVNNTQDLSVDYGHAFFYITRDDKVTVFFSFGPAGLGQGGKLTNEYNGKRPGDTSYAVTEIAKLFRMTITEKQASDVKIAADKFTLKVRAGQEFFDASLNDTCAETARDILSEGGVSTPSGSGPVKGGGVDWITTHGSFVNPYMWHKDFVAKYGSGITYYGTGGIAALQRKDGLLILVDPEWYLVAGADDPLVAANQVATTHGSLQPKKSS